MRVRGASAWMLAATLAIASCDDEASPELNVASVVTWNVGLADGYVEFAAERRPSISAAIAGLDADVVCLQEVWATSDVEGISDAAKATFPEHWSVELVDDTVGPPACPADDAQVMELSTCAYAACGETAPGSLGACVLEHCKDQFNAVPPACVQCLAANLGKPLDDIFQSCTTGSARYYAKGSNGLLMLSRHPLENRTHLALTSTNTQRSVLGATVDLPGLGPTDVYCTHLAADLESQLPYDGPYDSWGAENLAQLDAVLAQIEATRQTDQVLVLGDFNAGPAIAPDVAAELPASYQHMVDAGFRDWPGAEAGTPCTFCPDNTLVADDAPGVLIDHVYGRGVPASFANSGAQRIQTAPVTVQTSAGPLETNLSDHYGVRLQFDRGR